MNHTLATWTIPENGFTAQSPVTLRRLLSHNAGLPYVPLFGYAQNDPIPSREQILNGEPPANSDPVRVLDVPGSYYSYSNGGYLIVEQLLVDAAGMPFDTILAEIILEPLGLESINMQYPLPENLIPIAASGHLADGSVMPGAWHTFPEMGPGGSWWATPSDLARFYIDIMLTYTGQSEKVISRETALEMLTPQVEDRGLGPWIGDEGGPLFYFGHPGHNYGYKSYLLMYPKLGQGVVIMTNSENGDAIYQEILYSINNEYGWVKDYSVLYLSIAVLIIGGGGIFLIRRRKLTNPKS